MIKTSFDKMFLSWLNSEVNQIEGWDILDVAKQKGFTSVVEWRLNSALNMQLDRIAWNYFQIERPNHVLPKIIVGPYQGWSKFFNNKLATSFEAAL